MAVLKKGIRYILLPLIIILTVYLTYDYNGPATIELKESVDFGLPSLKAKDLIVQEYDAEGNLWATRGMIIYKLNSNGHEFRKIAHIPTGFTFLWLRNFSVVRKLTIRPECVEMTTNKTGICALSAGKMWFTDYRSRKFVRTFSLSNYGKGDQGIRNDGILNFKDSLLLIGEYFRNSERQSVRVFKTDTSFLSWNTAFEFPAGKIRHIHSVQYDPFGNKLWLCTGDNDKESIIGFFDDSIKNFNPIGQGNQMWRACQLIFTKKAVYWGTDTGLEEYAGIYRWDRETKTIDKLAKIDGAAFYATRLSNGTIVLSLDREGLPNEKDDKTHFVIISEDDKVKSFEGGSWDHRKKGFWYKYALMRLQRNEGSTSLAISCLNQKEFSDGELIIIDDNYLLSENNSFTTIK
jgi:hypothetical protein